MNRRNNEEEKNEEKLKNNKLRPTKNRTNMTVFSRQNFAQKVMRTNDRYNRNNTKLQIIEGVKWFKFFTNPWNDPTSTTRANFEGKILEWRLDSVMIEEAAIKTTKKFESLLYLLNACQNSHNTTRKVIKHKSVVA